MDKLDRGSWNHSERQGWRVLTLPLYDPCNRERFPTLEVCDVRQRERRKARHGHCLVPSTAQAARDGR